VKSTKNPHRNFVGFPLILISISIWDFPTKDFIIDKPNLYKEEAIAKIATNSSSHNLVDKNLVSRSSGQK